MSEVRWTLLIVLSLALQIVALDLVLAALQRRFPAVPVAVRPPRFDWRVLLITLAAWIAIPFASLGALSIVASDPTPVAKLAVMSVANLAVVAVILWLMLWSRRNRLRHYGIRLDGWRDDVRYGVAGFLASIVPVAVCLLITIPLRSNETQHALLKMLRENPSAELLLLIAVMAVVIAPLTEELIFRVVFQGLLSRVLPVRGAILLTAVVFAGVHGWPDMIPLFPLALVLGYLFHVRRSYLAVVVMHAMFNAANLILSLFAQMFVP